MELKGRVPSLKDIKLQAAALRTAASVGLAAAPVAGAAALELVSQVNTPTAEAAGNCKVQVAFDAFTYIDMYPINGLGRPGKLDLTEDPKIGPGVNMIGEVLDKKGGNVIGKVQLQRRSLPESLKKRLPNPFDRDNATLTEEGYGETEIMNVPCDNQKARVWVRTSQNRGDQEERVIPHGQMLHEIVGRKLESNEAIKLAYINLMSGDSRRQQIESWISRAVQSTPVAQPTAVPTPTFTPVPEAAARAVQVENSLTDRLLGLLTPAAILVAGGLAFLGLSRVRQSVDDAGHAINDQMADINTNLQGTNTHLGNMNNTLDNIANTTDEINNKLP